ncbi:hypothetical protein GCM10010222_80580 [Streptomyces tanashiensis]|nr:hypothetical protein GCM10010222_80580 [Streptomyces tanashiensis]
MKGVVIRGRSARDRRRLELRGLSSVTCPTDDGQVNRTESRFVRSLPCQFGRPCHGWLPPRNTPLALFTRPGQQMFHFGLWPAMEWHPAVGIRCTALCHAHTAAPASSGCVAQTAGGPHTGCAGVRDPAACPPRGGRGSPEERSGSLAVRQPMGDPMEVRGGAERGNLDL